MKHFRQFKIRYFDRFRVQHELFEATLDESFFREWHNKLSSDPTTDNWHNSAASCIHLLVRHKDAPDWLRDIYANDSRFERRQVALLSSSTYKYKHIHKILTDRSNILKRMFFATVIYDLQKGFEVQPEHIAKLIIGPVVLPTFKNMVRRAIQEEITLALIDPDPITRTLAKIFYNATPIQKQLLIDSIK
jgi:hypothetical protein